jgi:hypothetical protein
LTLAQADESRRHARRQLDRVQQQLFAATRPQEYASYRQHSGEPQMDQETVRSFGSTKEELEERRKSNRVLERMVRQRENELKRYQNGNSTVSGPLDYDQGVDD